MGLAKSNIYVLSIFQFPNCDQSYNSRSTNMYMYMYIFIHREPTPQHIAKFVNVGIPGISSL